MNALATPVAIELEGCLFYGELLTVASGKETSTRLVPASGGFVAVASAGESFAAVGSANPAGSKVTYG